RSELCSNQKSRSKNQVAENKGRLCCVKLAAEEQDPHPAVFPRAPVSGSPGEAEVGQSHPIGSASRSRDYRARGRTAMTRAMPPRIAIDESDRRIVIASPSAMVPASAVTTGTLN